MLEGGVELKGDGRCDVAFVSCRAMKNVGDCVGNDGNRVGNLRHQGALTAGVALVAYGKLSAEGPCAMHWWWRRRVW